MMFTDNETIWVNFTIDPNKLLHHGTKNVSVTIIGDIHHDTSLVSPTVSMEFDVYIPGK